MKFLGIVALSVGSAISYGIVHDQVTARVCVEYFTIGHPPLFATESPTLLALGWGIVATWWMGLLLGIPLACCCRIGSAPPLGPREVLRPLGVLLLAMAVVALLAGIAGYAAATSGRVFLLPPMADRVPAPKHAAFLADLWAHVAAYAAGFFGGLGLCARSVIRRRRSPPGGQGGRPGY
jgi:hypothetical protein